MSEFKVGDEVVAVGYRGADAQCARLHPGLVYPQLGEHCFVRAVGPLGGVMLHGYVNENGPAGREWEFHKRNFRVVRAETIAIFRQMCIDAPKIAKKVSAE